MPETFNLAKPDRPIRVGVILMNGVTEALDVVPVDLIHGVSKSFVDNLPDQYLPGHLKAQAIDAEFFWISEAGKSTPSNLTSGISVVPTDSFETCPPLDVVLVGAHKVGYIPNENELAFLRKSWENCSAFITICGGVDVALRAGILAGKTATGPRFALDMLRQVAPGTTWVEKRWVRDGKLWTSGTLVNGLDLMSAFIQETWGSGEGTLVDFMMKMSAWPMRDQGYKDVSWAF